ncbi:MAG: AEC family transporter [Clostridia bacterium]|nr:AEC family transporter [Clostridia bacterium]
MQFIEFIAQFTEFFNLILAFFILLIVGFVAGKTKIVDSVASKKLSALIIKIGQPALIINSLIKMEYSAEKLSLGFQTLLFGFAVHIFVAVLAFVAFRGFKNLDEQKLTEFAAIFGNVGFLGIPILKSLFGDTGEFMGAFFIVSFNVFLWTWGIMILARKRDDIKLTPKKLLNFGTVPCFIGFMLYLCCRPFFAFPTFVMKSFDFTASICTPISMFIIGALLATCTFKQIFCSGKIYYLCAVKLIIVPLIACAFLKLIGLDDWILFAAAVTSMPCATTLTMLAELYDINPRYSAQAVGTTSLFSVVTMPCVMFLAQKLVEL